jgi:pectate lyase
MEQSFRSHGERFVQIVKRYADRILELHRGLSGEEGLPLFADGFHAETLKPVEWLCGGQVWILSNLASQQNWLRLLCSLSRITGDMRYRSAAEQAVSYAFKHLRYGRLFQWGGHMAYDLAGKRCVYAPDKGPQHELKCHYPFYELMNEVDAGETKAYIEAFWNSHVLNWSNLEFSRHGKPVPDLETGSVWDKEYEGGEPFFTGTGLTFINAGSDLYYAAGMLYRFTGDEKPLMWAKRLNGRYSDTRNPQTGLGGYQFSVSVLPGVRGDRAIEQFGEQLKAHNPMEGTLSTARQIHTIIGKAGLCRMVLSESLGEAGREFADSALEDLIAYGRYAYEEAANLIHPVMTDGTRLTGLVMERSGYYGKQGDALQAAAADPLLLWSYALGFRLSKHPLLWPVVRGIAKAAGLGDFGPDAGGAPQANGVTGCADPHAVFALLELYRATGRGRYLELAFAIGDNIIRQGVHQGVFLSGNNRPYAKLDNIAPLALLHLAAEWRGIRRELPAYCGGSAFFGSAYDGLGHMTDRQLFYSRTR